MRVLVVSNTPFLPATAGNRARIGSMLEALRHAGHAIGMLLLRGPDAADADVARMRAQLDWLDAIPAPPDRWRRLTARFRRPSSGPIPIDAWCPQALRVATHARVGAWRPDLVLVEYVFLSACLENLPRHHRYRTMIDTHDLMHRRAAVYEELGMPPRWFHTTAAQERQGLLRADLLLAIHDEDAAVLRTLVPERPVLTVPHATRVLPAPLGTALADRVLCVASHNDLNVRGVHWLFAEVWPRLRACRPNAQLDLCGSIATKIGDAPRGVVVRGPIDALDAAYADARVVAAPVVGGTGLKVKVVEALGHGRPVVTTAAGAAGIAVGEAAGVLSAATPAQFADMLSTLLSDDAAWQRACAGAAHHAVRFSPEVAFAPLLAACATLQRPA
jgi:succinoglycan biosynthesis protein ExoO